MPMCPLLILLLPILISVSNPAGKTQACTGTDNENDDGGDNGETDTEPGIGIEVAKAGKGRDRDIRWSIPKNDTTLLKKLDNRVTPK